MDNIKLQIAILRAKIVARKDTFRAMRYLLAAGVAFPTAARFVAAHATR